MKPANVMILEVRSEEGRCAVNVDIGFLTRQERLFLFGLLQGAKEGGQVGFGVEPGEDERTKVVKFTLTNPVAVSVSSSVQEALHGRTQ